MASTKSDDPIIYFTLIDFLVQLIFLAIFLVVALQASQRGPEPAQGQPPPWVADPAYVPLLNEGVGPFIRDDDARDLLRLLKAIYDEKLLEPLLAFLTKTPNPLAVLKSCSTDPATCSQILSRCTKFPDSCEALAGMSDSKFGVIGQGEGKPQCRDRSGKSARLFTVYGEIGPAGALYRIEDISAFGMVSTKEAGIDIANGVVYDKSGFRRVFLPFTVKKCAHVVHYIDRTDSNRQADVVRSVFLFRSGG
jgi:hypothetical protein